MLPQYITIYYNIYICTPCGWIISITIISIYKVDIFFQLQIEEALYYIWVDTFCGCFVTALNTSVRRMVWAECPSLCIQRCCCSSAEGSMHQSREVSKKVMQKKQLLPTRKAQIKSYLVKNKTQLSQSSSQKDQDFECQFILQPSANLKSYKSLRLH